MSKLRADEFVNSDDNGAPSFPHSANVPAPTADNHFATKLYTDTSASTKSSSITNTISNTAPSNPSAGDFWTNTSQNIISLNIWNGSSWVNVKNSIEISAGQIVTPPSISDPNGGYIPTMLTATSAVVSDATLSSSKWYKDDVEIPGATGLQYYATDTGTYKYEEIWVDTFGTQLFPSLSAVIDARAGVIDAQPTITSSNGVYSPTTLTATAAVVSNATLVGSRWYKDGIEIPDSSGLSINILAHEGGIYKYEETWTDHFGTQLLPTLSASVQVFATIADPTVLTPANDTGVPDFVYEAASSAIANVDSVKVTQGGTVGDTIWASTNVGDLVSIYDSTNGKVVIAYHDQTDSNYGKAVVGTVSGTNINFGSITTFNSARTQNISVTFDSTNNKVVIAYEDYGNSQYGTAIVGTVSGTSISFGSSVAFNSATTQQISATFDSNNNKVVIAYRDYGNFDYGTAIVGTISGTSISFGSPTVFNSNGRSIGCKSIYDPINQKVVITYRDDGNSNYGTAIVGTVSGTSISFGTAVVYNSAATQGGQPVHDSTNNKIVIAYHDDGNSNAGTAVVGTVSGTSISFGSPVVFTTSNNSITSATYDPTNNKVVIAYLDWENSNYGTVASGTVSGTSISFGTPVVFHDAYTYPISLLYDSTNNQVVIVYREGKIGGYGTAGVFIESGLSIPQLGSPTVFESATTYDTSATFDSTNNKVVIAYKDAGNSFYGTAVVGEVSGTSISFGSPVVFESANSHEPSVTFDSSTGKVVIAYSDGGNSDYGTAVVGTVSGTSISFGSPVVFESASSLMMSSTFDSTNNKIVISYRDAGNSYYGTAIVGTVSGNSISFGTPAVFETSYTNITSATYDSSNQKVVIAYKDQGNNDYGTAVVGTVSGTSISFGSPVVFESARSESIEAVYDSTNGKVVIAYRDYGNSENATAIVGTVSGTSISFGSPVVFHTNADNLSATYDSTSGKVVIAYTDKDNSYNGTAIPGTVSGTSITFGSPTEVESGDTYNVTSAYDSTNGKVVIAYRDHGNSSYGTAVVFSPVTTETQLTLTDTTVSKISDGSLIGGTSIDQVLTVGETVQASGIENYWITTFSHPTDASAEPRGLAFDNSGNIYVAGEESSVDNAAYLAKFNGTGNITWQTSLNYSGANEAANDVAVDSFNNVYYCGYSQMAGNNGAIVVKYNNSGTLQWQRLLTTTTGYQIRLNAVEVDSSDNVIVTGYAKVGSSGSETTGVLIAKYNSSGVLQWSRTLDQQGSGWSPNKNEYGYDIAVDSSDNIYICGEAGNSSYGSTDCLIAKYDSSGNIQWQKLLGDQYSTTEDRFSGITVDSSDNIYVVGHSEKPTDNNDTIIAKYDASGNLAWQKYIQNDAKGKAIDTDSSGNVYILSENIRVVGAGNADLYIAKLDSSGNIQWQNTLGGAYNELTFDLCVDSSDNLYISGATRSLSSNAYNQLLVAKLPTDGSLVGTYGGLTYQSVSLNIATSTLQDRTSNFTDSANPQINDSVSTLPDEFDPGHIASVTTITGVSGTVSASSGNTITLSDVSGTWSTGMKVQGVDSDIKDNPDPINPSALSLTSSEPATTQGSVTTWGNAQWQIAEDSGFTTNVQSLTSALTSSGTQTGPTGFTLDYNKNYYVRTKYGSSNPANIFSNWSVASLFKTGAEPFYVDDMFSTYLYEGNSSGQGANAQTINNGIDLAGEGGLVWIKNRTQGGTNAWSHYLFDTERGATKYIRSNDTGAEQTSNYSLSAFNSDGLTLGETSGMNNNGDNYVSWTFRKAPGFFDVVTYTGNGTSGRTVSHNLGSVPGMIIVKKTSGTGSWCVYHRSMGNSSAMFLQQTDAAFSSPLFNNTTPTSTEFTVNNGGAVNGSGQTYVAYIFAHDDQSFGTNSDESIIKCGSWTTDSSTGDIPEVDLGWEPQFMLWKNVTSSGDWWISDSARGWLGGTAVSGGSFTQLRANLNNAEGSSGGASGPLLTPTGFKNDGANYGTSQTYIYMAIRRPHKPATVATDVFNISEAVGLPRFQAPFVTDMMIGLGKTGYQNKVFNRLTGTEHMELTNSNAEITFANMTWDHMNGAGTEFTNSNFFTYMFRRAPGFFDVVTADYPSISEAIPHNLGVAPELIINKPRDGTIGWMVGSDYLQNTNGWNRYIEIHSSGSEGGTSTVWDQTAPTATHFTLGSYPGTSYTGIFYLFASLDGISKVGSYSGTGSNIDVDCGFAAGARFILIKRTDSTGDWYVWDTERGIISGNDPYLLLNSTAAEVTNTDYIDPLNAGFTVTSSAPAALNASGGTYLFLAIA